ncbi:tubulinyl-Tyr carboxypeptidase 2-like [Watersipora subatra]|uniref:tubulinyl-Tyr carboxypeptidase 2-like n=1 Tax=Watersipora subatra TaxID=2589382 RepID=UPI00355C60DA
MNKTRGAVKRPPSDTDSQDGTDEVLFWINKSGFPISESVWDRMFDHASKLHPGGESYINRIRTSKTSAAVSIPKAPIGGSSSDAERRVQVVQQYMCELQYNHTGTQFFDIKKYRPLNSQSESAKEMIKESLPIKCLEAVILGIYLTNGISGLERYPLSFRSVFGSKIHRHVVLVVCWNGLYGALGMSRREDLMHKPLHFTSLSDLVIDYIESYNQYHHKVNKLKIGFPVSHDPHSHEPIHWKGLAVNPCKMDKTELKQAVEKHAKDIRTWVRQAPFGTSYAPRSQATSYPTPSFSQTTPRVHKAADGNKSRPASMNGLERSCSRVSDAKGLKSTPHTPSNKLSFEMRI